MDRRLLAVVGVVVAAVVAIGVFAATRDRGTAPVTATPSDQRETAPAFTLPGLDGGRVSLREYAGRPVVVNFWASYCLPCREEMPLLARFARDNPQLRVLGVAVNDNPQDSRAFARDTGVEFDLAIDRDASVLGSFGGTGLPLTVLIDARGRVVTTHIGTIDAETLAAMARLT